MSVYDKEYKGCALIIREIETNNVIAKTAVDNYSRTDMVISVNERSFSLEGMTHVLIEIFQDMLIYKFMGTVRRMRVPPLRQISLFKGKIATDYRANRYPVKTFATIQELIFDEVNGDIERLCPPIKVLLLNISNNGVLFKTSCDFLSVGLSFKLVLKINQTDIFMNMTIVRSNKGNRENEREYGCHINYVYE